MDFGVAALAVLSSAMRLCGRGAAPAPREAPSSESELPSRTALPIQLIIAACFRYF